MPNAPGTIRDTILTFLAERDGEASAAEIRRAVTDRMGEVPASSVRSFLRLNANSRLEKVARGRYRLREDEPDNITAVSLAPAIAEGRATLFHADCFAWLRDRAANSVHAVVTDPPYGVVEYSERELAKLREGKGGGVWRVPPAFDGTKRSPLPRFTTLTVADRTELSAFFRRLGTHLARVVVPGGNVVIASNPLLCHLVAGALAEAGLEPRGYLARLTMTMRGGDRPKNAHEEFSDVSVMPRSQWEPWVVMRRPLEGRVQDNLRKWGTGGFKRPSDERPFGDVIKSSPTTKMERTLAPHPSLKPQAFLRQVVRAVLPRGTGVVLDPFAGSGSTLAAANAVGYDSIGVEADPKFVRLAEGAIGKLAAIKIIDPA
jgi:site-specific DNA-methyltransferase (adenine-specific)